MSDQPTKLVIRNIGRMLSGRMQQPILDADCLIAENGKITAWGNEADLNTEHATTLVHANDATLTPGLIDSHVPPVIGDYTPPPATIALDRLDPARRRHDFNLCRRGPHARPPARHHRPQGNGDSRPALA